MIRKTVKARENSSMPRRMLKRPPERSLLIRLLKNPRKKKSLVLRKSLKFTDL